MSTPSSPTPGRVFSRAAAVAWSAILVSVWGPLLLGLGYGLLDPEFLLLAAGSLLLGTGLAAVTASSVIARVPICAVLLFLALDTHFMDVVNWGIGAIDLSAVALGCWLIRDHVLRILGVGALAFVAATAATSERVDPVPFSRAATVDREAPPAIVHFILDEHSGSGGLPPELWSEAAKDVIDRRWVAQGFEVFTEVRSSSAATHKSLSRLMNPHLPPSQEILDMHSGRFEYAMLENGYLAGMLDRGYRVHVLQSSFLDLCTDRLRDRIDCRTYPHNSAATLRDLDLSLPERLLILGSMVDWSLRRAHNSIVFETLDRSGLGIALNDWRVVHARWRVQPLVSRRMIGYLERELASARRGELYVAHLLLPHHPYIYAADCSIAAPEEWVDIHVPSRIGTLEVRAERYLRYAEQMDCADALIARLVRIIDANPALADATVVIHGDHGSRIGPWRFVQLGPGYTASDHRGDFFTTFYAIRGPGIRPGTDREERELPQVFWATPAVGPPRVASREAAF